MEKENKKNVFSELYKIDVNEHKEEKNGLTYLSWVWAWAEVKKAYPDACYEIFKDENHKPYFEDEELGIMCYTSVTINGQTHEMWLPVMNGANKAMKRRPYKYKVYNRINRAYDEKEVEAATMMDINKTIMRCLTKNLAMFGLGLYIYAGEDLPEISPVTGENSPKVQIYQEAMNSLNKAVSRSEVREIYDEYIDKIADKVKNAAFKSECNEKYKSLPQ